MLIMMVYAVLMKYWSSGPQWPQEQDAYSTYCNESWWTNLLYVNNLVKVKKMVGSHFRQRSLALLNTLYSDEFSHPYRYNKYWTLHCALKGVTCRFFIIMMYFCP